jgi:DUF4097 and DUF4098 domain-containing protein YvlB
MKNSRILPLLIPLCAAFATAVLPTPAEAGLPTATVLAVQSISARHPAAKNGTVEISAVSTRIEIVGTDAAELTVTGELPDGWKLEITPGKRKTKIKVEPPRRSKAKPGHLVIHVPSGSQLRAAAVSGDLTITGVSGDVTTSAVSGNLRVDGGKGELVAGTVSGDMSISGPIRRATLKAVSGNVDAKGLRGALTLGSVSGNVTLTDVELSRSNVKNVSGNIRIEGALEGGGPHRIVSHSGDVELRLPAGQALDLSLRTFSGSVKNALGGVKGSKKHDVVIGSGGPTVEISTFSGNIVLGVS